ncbi:MAG: LPS-assembly protein LptD [Gammaproteobacteria bacterium]
MRLATSIIVGFTLSGAPAAALAQSGATRGIECWPELPETGPADIGAEDIELTSGDADIQADGSATFSGPIELRSETRLLKAGSAVYDREEGRVSAKGNVEYEDPLSKIKGESVEYNTTTGQFNFSDAEFEFRDIPARGSATRLNLIEAGVLELKRARITSCPEGRDDWMLRAKRLELNKNTGMGTAKGMSLDFKGVPFLYLPYFTYPITDERKSGLLLPEFGNSDKRGVEYTQPVYWNISPGMDATYRPRYMSDRGLQHGLEYRYLSENNEGVLYGDYLSDDDETDEKRWQYEVETQTFLPYELRASIYGAGVSDNNYLEDMGQGIAQTSQTHLNREAKLEYYDSVWSVNASVQDYQTVIPTFSEEDDPYTQAPRIDVNALWYDGILGLDYGFDSETAYFLRDESTEGLRFHIRPKVSRTFGTQGLYIKPEAQFDYTAYSLDDQPEENPSSPDRAAPILSLDTGAVFEKIMPDSGRTFTIEPRAMYTWIPDRNQDDLPVFDTIRPDFNLVQLYRKNDFVGYDRLGSVNKVSYGITSRVLDSNNGREVFRATVGQTRFLESDDVTLPDEEPISSRKSTYIGELDILAWKNISANMRYEYDSDERETQRSSFGVGFRPDTNKAINLSYRYGRDDFEQGRLYFGWPINKSWNVLGSYTYSFFEKQKLNEYYGIEYSSCCWSIRVVAEKSVVRSTGDRDASVGIEFALKGLSGFGSGSADSATRDILAY